MTALGDTAPDIQTRSCRITAYSLTTCVAYSSPPLLGTPLATTDYPIVFGRVSTGATWRLDYAGIPAGPGPIKAPSLYHPLISPSQGEGLPSSPGHD